MRIATAALAAAFMAAFTVPALTVSASATVRITSDPGGQIGPYLDKLESLRKSGQNVVIDGTCLSACTMVLGVIPRDHLCVTPRARLGFHSAWSPDQAGRQVTNREGTDLLMSVYPEQIREWIAQRGGLSPHLIYLSGRDLAAMYPSCQGDAHEQTVSLHPEPGRGHFEARAMAQPRHVRTR